VIDCFAADYDMIAQSTGLHTQETVTNLTEDVKAFAEYGYMNAVDIVLDDASGKRVCAAKYKVSTEASLWRSDRPGNNLWPRISGGSLSIVISPSQSWDLLNDSQQAAFRQERNRNWGPSSIDVSYPGLVGHVDRRYSSNAYGIEKSLYR
jgi:hypothetical protein